MSCNYCWNQPIKHGKYDFYLDGKIKADDFVYRTKDESGEIIPIKISEKFEELENRLETHFTFDNSYKTYDELQDAFAHRKLKESVIYIVTNENTSDDPDMRDVYNEYMIMGGKLELIGSGSYAKQTADLYTVTGYTTFKTFDNKKTDGEDINSRINKEIADRIADVNDEEKRATDEEKRIEERLDQEIADRIADVTAEEERAIEEEKRIEEKLDQEIEDREADVNAEEKRAIEVENELSARIKTIEDYNIDNRVKQLEIDLPAEINRAKGEENNLLKKFDDYTTTTELQSNYSTKSALKEVDDKFADYTTTAVLEESYVTITSLQQKINELNGTIAALEERIAALEPVPEPEPDPEEPENGEVTEPTDPETPTE